MAMPILFFESNLKTWTENGDKISTTSRWPKYGERNIQGSPPTKEYLNFPTFPKSNKKMLPNGMKDYDSNTQDNPSMRRFNT